MSVFEAVGKGALLASLVSITACATADPNADFSATDRFEGTSRTIHEFNLTMDRYVLRPAAQGYNAVTPTLIKHLIGNGFSHLTLPRDFANYLLQGEVTPALKTLGRFTVNTVIGAGVLDPATEFGLPKKDTDFGVTLGKHGVGEGAYFVLPFFGPTTGRDAVGRVVDLAFAPTTYVGAIDSSLSPEVPIAALALETIDFRDRNMDVIDDVLYESEDSYVSLRAIYLQRRRAQVAGDEAGADSLPDIFDSN